VEGNEEREPREHKEKEGNSKKERVRSTAMATRRIKGEDERGRKRDPAGETGKS
jgi:hypothetical protein